MGKANFYTVKDNKTGEVLAKGTAGELEASGIVPKGYHASEWVKWNAGGITMGLPPSRDMHSLQAAKNGRLVVHSFCGVQMFITPP